VNKDHKREDGNGSVKVANGETEERGRNAGHKRENWARDP